MPWGLSADVMVIDEPLCALPTPEMMQALMDHTMALHIRQEARAMEALSGFNFAQERLAAIQRWLPPGPVSPLLVLKARIAARLAEHRAAWRRPLWWEYPGFRWEGLPECVGRCGSEWCAVSRG